MKLFAGAIVAMKIVNENYTQMVFTPVATMATDKQSAKEALMKNCLETYPQSDGYIGQATDVVEVSTALLVKVLKGG
jgi:hypothetical protein